MGTYAGPYSSIQPRRGSGSRCPTAPEETGKAVSSWPAALHELLLWPQGTFDVKCGDPPPLPFSACLLDDVMDVRGPDRPPVGWSRFKAAVLHRPPQPQRLVSSPRGPCRDSGPASRPGGAATAPDSTDYPREASIQGMLHKLSSSKPNRLPAPPPCP